MRTGAIRERIDREWAWEVLIKKWTKGDKLGCVEPPDD
jgi:hypothetical protein